MTSPAPVSLAGRIDDARASVDAAGYSPTLWVPEHGWDAEEAEVAEDPFAPQLLAALECFIAFWGALFQKTWVHLAAEMQAGKTGVVTALIRMMMVPMNHSKIKIRATRIFVLTGMNDDAWKIQTRRRLPTAIRENVYHNGGLKNFAKKLTSLAAGSYLRDVLIIIDESHLASAVKNRPQKLIYETVLRLCPQELWAENNIRFLTISATDPAKVLVMRGDQTAKVVRLQTTEGYQSIESLAAAERIRWLEDYGNLHEKVGMDELKRCVAEKFSDAPRYHILRPRMGKSDLVADMLAKEFPGARVIRYDSETKAAAAAAAGGAGAPSSDTGSVSSLAGVEDINEILSVAPEQHTFIVIKNMFYAAKTLDDAHVGVLWDRLGGKDDTNLQSLLGRACGYGKSERTIVYACRSTTDNYIGFWRELCSSVKAEPLIEDKTASELSGKMPGIVASKVKGGGACLHPSATVAAPMGAAVGGAGGSGPAAAAAIPKKAVADEDDFVHMYTTHSTLEAARFPHMRTPKQDAAGFYLTSTTKSPERQSYAACLTLCTGKKTSNLPWKDLAVGKSVRRLYVGYRNMSDPTSAVFFVRTLTRKK
jgi:hypothetical protein